MGIFRKIGGSIITGLGAVGLMTQVTSEQAVKNLATWISLLPDFVFTPIFTIVCLSAGIIWLLWDYRWIVIIEESEE